MAVELIPGNHYWAVHPGARPRAGACVLYLHQNEGGLCWIDDDRTYLLDEFIAVKIIEAPTEAELQAARGITP